MRKQRIVRQIITAGALRSSFSIIVVKVAEEVAFVLLGSDVFWRNIVKFSI